MSDATAPRRVLAIDGGGMNGMVPAALLAEVEAHIDGRLWEHFDLMVGTSTGGIIAAGLAMGYSAAEIVSFYKEEGPRIFGSGSLLDRTAVWLTRLLRAPHRTAILRSRLAARFGEAPLGEARTRLVVTSWSGATGKVVLRKTRHCGRLRTDHSKPIVDALVETANAPTFFVSDHVAGGTGFIDGGLWANNPSLVAAVEAIGVLRWPRESVRLLSLGCVHEPWKQPSGSGLLHWRKAAVEAMFAAQSSGAHGSSVLLLGDNADRCERLLRVVPDVPPGRFPMNSVRRMRTLEQIGRELGRYNLGRLRRQFFFAKSPPFAALPEDADDEAVA